MRPSPGQGYIAAAFACRRSPPADPWEKAGNCRASDRLGEAPLRRDVAGGRVGAHQDGVHHQRPPFLLRHFVGVGAANGAEVNADADGCRRACPGRGWSRRSSSRRAPGLQVEDDGGDSTCVPEGRRSSSRFPHRV
uniref:Uncharacterized protein n=1 Tax=Triticum urartu TaxID=4572 RepID=A0A8R7JZP1_TRIUA